VRTTNALACREPTIPVYLREPRFAFASQASMIANAPS
jgi:hypothetical protein